MVSISYSCAALLFVCYVPVGVLGILTSPENTDYNERWRGWLIASNAYGWSLTIITTGWYTVLILFITAFHKFDDGVIKPSILIPVIGIIIEIVLRVLYQIAYDKSEKLMNCWVQQDSEYCSY